MTRCFTWSGLIYLGSGLMFASFLIGLPARVQVNTVRYGGKPPWSLEKPVHIRGRVHVGEVFEQALGRGLYFVLMPADTGWRARTLPPIVETMISTPSEYIPICARTERIAILPGAD